MRNYVEDMVKLENYYKRRELLLLIKKIFLENSIKKREINLSKKKQTLKDLKGKLCIANGHDFTLWEEKEDKDTNVKFYERKCNCCNLTQISGREPLEHKEQQRTLKK